MKRATTGWDLLAQILQRLQDGGQTWVPVNR